MTKRRLLSCSVLVLLAVAPARASKSPPEIHALPSDQQAALVPTGGSSLCTLGERRAGVYLVNYLLPPDDIYYTHLDHSDCVTCDPGRVSLGPARIRLYFPAVCSQQVAVSVVGSLGTTCPYPNPSLVLCPEVVSVLTPASVGVFDFDLALPEDCSMAGDGFLSVRFIDPAPGCATTPSYPRFVTADTCAVCRSYNYFRGGEDELCAVAFPGNPLMSVAVSACELVTGVGPVAGQARVGYPAPNPMSARMSLRIELDRAARLRAGIYDVAGRVIRRLDDREAAAGAIELSWNGRADDGTAVAGGVYFARVTIDGVSTTRTIMLRP